MKTNVESLKKTISELKKEMKEKTQASENPKADKGLRSVKKQLKRTQRKLRLLCPPVAEKEKKEEAPAEKKAEAKAG